MAKYGKYRKQSSASKPKVHTYGSFIQSIRNKGSVFEVAEAAESGLSYHEIKPILAYLNLTIPDIAKAAAVSPSTVSRWTDNSTMNIAGSSQFVKIDRVLGKGLEVFGGKKELLQWLNTPNVALGNALPSKLILNPVSIELVDQALDALSFGTIM